MRTQSDFSRFYLQHVAHNEVCGCAELIIRNHDADNGREAGDGILSSLAAVILWPVGAILRWVRRKA